MMKMSGACHTPCGTEHQALICFNKAVKHQFYGKHCMFNTIIKLMSPQQYRRTKRVFKEVTIYKIKVL